MRPIYQDVEWEEHWPDDRPSRSIRLLGRASGLMGIVTLIGGLFAVMMTDAGHRATAVAAGSESVSRPAAPGVEAVVGSVPEGVWTFDGALGASHAVVGDGAHKQLALRAAGATFDLWGTSRSAPRLMRPVADEDFTVSMAFASAPTERYQMQGTMVEGRGGEHVRADVHSDGELAHVFAGVTSRGKSAPMVDVALETPPSHLALNRAGSSWTVDYSYDGKTWRSAGRFDHPMTVTAAGIFAGKTSKAADFTALVDTFELQPADAAATVADTSAATSPPAETGAVPPVGTVTPQTAAPAIGEPVAAEVVAEQPAAETAAGVARSDEFEGDTLSDIWRFEGIKDVSVRVADGQLLIEIPKGEFDLWNDKKSAPRLMQPARDEDISVRAKFLSSPSRRYQTNGVLFEGKSGDWLRIDIYSDGKEDKIFAASSDGKVSRALLVERLDGSPSYLAVDRMDDVFQIALSDDGERWRQVRNFRHHMDVTAVGLFAAATEDAGGYTARVASFQIADGPITREQIREYEVPGANVDTESYDQDRTAR
ncbi:DUF1349 domain-containing protein [Acuticoccus sediminis]|uniref:DUF1349 domain-containing protein n=1 Tax=Acuticoccus sediminis TaxID=2184697 RepID=UPI001CFC9D6A|nr:DUF1349 domain-containing protein [Acuticoccus sediminis]